LGKVLTEIDFNSVLLLLLILVLPGHSGLLHNVEHIRVQPSLKQLAEGTLVPMIPVVAKSSAKGPLKVPPYIDIIQPPPPQLPVWRMSRDSHTNRVRAFRFLELNITTIAESARVPPPTSSQKREADRIEELLKKKTIMEDPRGTSGKNCIEKDNK
jgi:hypothetical protein